MENCETPLYGLLYDIFLAYAMLCVYIRVRGSESNSRWNKFFSSYVNSSNENDVILIHRIMGERKAKGDV